MDLTAQYTSELSRPDLHMVKDLGDNVDVVAAIGT
jgi:hypothetical protein